NFDRASQLTGELRVVRDRLRLLLEVGNLLVSHLDYVSLLKAISESLRRVVRHDYVSVAVYDERAGGLRVPLTFDETRGTGRPEIVWPIEGSPAGTAFQRRQISVFDRSEIDAFPREGTVTLPRTDPQRLCCVPLIARRGAVGTLNVSSADPDAFSKGDVDLLGHLSLQIAIAVENAIAYRAVENRDDHLLEEKQYLENEIRL